MPKTLLLTNSIISHSAKNRNTQNNQNSACHRGELVDGMKPELWWREVDTSEENNVEILYT